MTPTTAEIEKHFWWHSIDLGNGVVTPGRKTPEIMAFESAAIFGPIDLRGRSVLDVGTWNGGFAIEAKRRGADRVMATDSFVWRHEQFRGREAFDLAVRATGLHIESREIDVTEVSPASTGSFEVVLFLGVFYHLFSPINVLQQVAAVTREVLVVETHVDAEDISRPAMIMYPGSELNNDPSNWWGPNHACMMALLSAVGFSRVVSSPASSPGRMLYHAWRDAE